MKKFSNHLFRLTAPAILIIVGMLINFTPTVFGGAKPGGGQTFTTIDFPGAVNTNAFGINSRGDIVGLYGVGDGKAHGFLFSKGVYTSIDFPLSNLAATVARGINDRGDIVGFYNGVPGAGIRRQGFLLRDGNYTSFDFPRSIFTETIMSINNRGDILGHYVDECDGLFHYGLLNGERFTKIDFPGAADQPDGLGGINNRGDMVGLYTSADGVNHGFLMSSNGSTITFTTIDFPGAIATFASGINDRGDIGGGYTDPTGRRHGFLLSNGRFTTIDFPGAANTNGAFAINERGDIAGSYGLAGKTHGFLMTNGSNDD